MKLEILDIEQLIAVNKLEQVTSPRLFANSTMFDVNGILSTEIFGLSKSDRRNTYAYIDLHRKFIHPHIYNKVIKDMFRNITSLVSGQKRFKVLNGQLMEDPSGWTGIDSLYEHWDEIDWMKFKSARHAEKELLSNLDKRLIFIDKLLIIPPAYRDVMISGTVDNSDHVSPLNSIYIKIMRLVDTIKLGGSFARLQYATQSKIEESLVELLNWFKDQISKKQGLIRKNLMGKSIDYGVRAVISAPTYNHSKVEDSMIDMEHAAVPLSHCCSLYLPFIESWLRNFFTREIINDPNLVSYYDHDLKRTVTAKMVDPEIQYSEKNIKKMIDDFILNPNNRFKLINVTLDDPRKKGGVQNCFMGLKGKVFTQNNVSSILSRPMTVTDLLYLACVDVCEKRHVMISRYPVGTDKGIIFNKIRVQSTVNHIKLQFNNKMYDYYPDIDVKLSPDQVGISFVDTLVVSNSHLDGMGEIISASM